MISATSARHRGVGEPGRDAPLARERERAGERSAKERLVAERTLDAELHERAFVIVLGPAGNALGGRARAREVASLCIVKATTERVRLRSVSSAVHS